MPHLEVSLGMLAPDIWLVVERTLGLHSTDLMALDSNVMNSSRHPLPHFSPFPTPGAKGVNLFAQDLSCERNPYVYAPFSLVEFFKLF